MSITRILCDKCGYPIAWCECRRKQEPLYPATKESKEAHRREMMKKLKQEKP